MTTQGRKSRAPGPFRFDARPRALTAAALLACASAPLQAQSPRVGGEFAFATQLVDRGLAITPATPVLQGAVEWDTAGGWSLGLVAAAETRSPGQPTMVLARVSRSWRLSDDWRAQASLLHYDYHRGRIPDHADANLYFAYRDTLAVGVSVIRVEGAGSGRWRGAADAAFSWPLTRHVSLSAGVGIAQAAVRARGYGPYPPSGYRYQRVMLYGYGNVGLAWSAGPWRLQVDRTRRSLGERRVYGTGAPSDWIATLSRSF